MYGFTLDHLDDDVWYNEKHVGDIAQSGSGWYVKAGSYLQSNTDVRQCTAVLTGVLIRHLVPITESLTADLMAVVTSREATLLEYLADHARRRVERGAGARRPLQGVPRWFGERRRHLVKTSFQKWWCGPAAVAGLAASAHAHASCVREDEDLRAGDRVS